MMSKLKLFRNGIENDIQKEHKKFVISNYNTKPMVMINFAILPTHNTKKLFTEIWCKYDKNTCNSIINFNEVFKKTDDFYSELNIINSMFFRICVIDKGLNEMFIEYPIIIEIIKTPLDIRLKFHDKFKIYFDKFLEL